MDRYTVYASKAEDVRKRLEKLAKKAVRYNVPFSFVEGAEHPQTIRVTSLDPATHTIVETGRYTVAAVDFDIECDELVRANGWSVRAKVEHGKNGNIVTGIGAKPVDEGWYNAPAVCEHCKTSRFRSVRSVATACAITPASHRRPLLCGPRSLRCLTRAWIVASPNGPSAAANRCTTL